MMHYLRAFSVDTKVHEKRCVFERIVLMFCEVTGRVLLYENVSLESSQVS